MHRHFLPFLISFLCSSRFLNWVFGIHVLLDVWHDLPHCLGTVSCSYAWHGPLRYLRADCILTAKSGRVFTTFLIHAHGFCTGWDRLTSLCQVWLFDWKARLCMIKPNVISYVRKINTRRFLYLFGPPNITMSILLYYCFYNNYNVCYTTHYTK